MKISLIKEHNVRRDIAKIVITTQQYNLQRNCSSNNCSNDITNIFNLLIKPKTILTVSPIYSPDNPEPSLL